MITFQSLIKEKRKKERKQIAQQVIHKRKLDEVMCFNNNAFFLMAFHVNLGESKFRLGREVITPRK